MRRTRGVSHTRLPPHPPHKHYIGRMAFTVKRVEPGQNEFLAELERKSGKENYFFRTMANKPEVLKNFVPLYRSIMGPGSVDLRIKEMAYIAVSYVNECPYCLAAHVASGSKTGITEQEMRAIQTEQNQDFTPPERAALNYARELTRTCDVDSRDQLVELFTDEQLVELTLVIAMANFTNRFNNGLRIRPEE
jgi:uncharacterized peroxidase-related enzyme